MSDDDNDGMRVVSGAAGLPGGAYLVRYRKSIGGGWNSANIQDAATLDDARAVAASYRASGHETMIMDKGGKVVT